MGFDFFIRGVILMVLAPFAAVADFFRDWLYMPYKLKKLSGHAAASKKRRGASRKLLWLLWRVPAKSAVFN